MYKISNKDLEIFNKAKNNQLVPSIMLLTSVLLALLVCYFEIDIANLNNQYSIFIASFAFILFNWANSDKKWSFVSKHELLSIIERMVNENPEALEQLSKLNEKTEKSEAKNI